MMRSAITLLVAVFYALQAAAASSDDGPDHVTRTSEGYRTARDGSADASRPTETRRVAPDALVTKPKDAMSQVRTTALGDHWVYDAFVEIDGDIDGDGYFHFLRVTFDVDSLYTSAYVYAELYLSADGETWEHFYSTDDFLVEGQTDFDEYEVETELVSGYPRGYYDVLIEIYDADSGEYVDEFGPAQSSAMSLLPLEDMRADGVPEPPATVVVEEHGGGGAAVWLVLLAAALPARRLGRRSRSLDRVRRAGFR